MHECCRRVILDASGRSVHLTHVESHVERRGRWTDVRPIGNGRMKAAPDDFLLESTSWVAQTRGDPGLMILAHGHVVQWTFVGELRFDRERHVLEGSLVPGVDHGRMENILVLLQSPRLLVHLAVDLSDLIVRVVRNGRRRRRRRWLDRRRIGRFVGDLTAA